MPEPLKPVDPKARYVVLDLVRGFSLFGVLLVNLLYFFRVSLFDHMLHEHSHPGWANHAVDDFVAQWIEFKAFDLFSLTFGIGVAMQAANGAGFLARRFAVLLVFGLAHITLVSNVDILTLYALCGFALIPLLRLPAAVLAIAGVVAVFAPSLLPVPALPDLPSHAAAATRVYRDGSYAAILAFRWHETVRFILPLLIAVAQKTLGMMMLGIAVWRSSVIRNAERYRKLLWLICALALGAGLLLHQHVPLAIAYGTALLAWRRSERAKRWTAPIAAAGRMAFTNYLTQSLVFALVFYGTGLFGRLSPVTAASGGVAFYALQVWWSFWWLDRHRFGPFEWIWRSLTYGRRQPWGK